MHTPAATLAALSISASALAGFTQIDETYFAGTPFVGVDPIGDLTDQPVTVGFDFTPDGTPIGTPHNIGSGLFFSDPIDNVFAPVGLLIDPGSRAVSQPSNPAGIGAMSGVNTLASEIAVNPAGTIVFTFTNGVSAAGFFALDGPTNEVSASFYDTSGNLITTLQPSDPATYHGIESDIPIGSIIITTSAGDDYYVENLSFINVPSPAAIVAIASPLAFRRRR